MNKPQKDSQVQVAKITAFQAIAVALITVAGGSLGYFLGESGKAKSKSEIKQNALIIKNVDYAGKARIVVSVNGNNFSYPATKIWAGNMEQAPQEKIPLPLGEQYKIFFTALICPSDPTLGGVYETKFFYQEEIGRPQIPTGDKTASCIPNADSPSGIKPQLKVSYAIE
jgi:hypothetical protein